MWKKLEPYRSSIVLLLALVAGATLGIVSPELALKVKPIGQIFLNLLFMIIVPLVGISVMSSIAEMTDLKKLGKLLGLVLIVSITMAAIPALGIIGVASIFDPAQGVVIDLNEKFTGGQGGMDFVSMFTTNDFVGLLSKSNILALIIMSVLGGIAIGQAGERGKVIAELLKSANEVVMNIVGLIMKGAPLGLGAFFAATMAEQDTELLSTFASASILFFVTAAIYFVIGSIVYSYIGGGVKGVKAFWKNAAEPSITALGTCSSLGTLPVTIRAAKNMGIREEIADICLPLLVNLNKGGVAMIAALKIVFIYAVLGMPFTFDVFITTMIIAILSAIIVGGVPGGAFLGEIFIVTTLGLPLEVIPMLVVIGTITDAPATLLNVIHDLNATQIVERFMGKKDSQTQENPQKQLA
ncbi:sodium:dicarboxylate symporter [Vibrio panuliri]|uniref:Sodium:dicarboxylate symporter n=1 Tax=Vibrio panuliri TaxID=1381081 RepID=A0A1Q9HFV4_9VIBR|nr:dicarboxylate/amino acid:cation symporter [Vibrio panuliri]OLQ88696.1 sodium:dicarboxylate symporter [Vibrio panuliri]